MKSLLFSCAPLFVFLAISGKNTLPPDYTEKLTGVYTITYMNWNGDIARLPEPGFSGTIRMTKVDRTHLQMTFSVKAEGKGKTLNETSDPRQIELRPNDRQSFFLYDDGVKLGTISPKMITIKTTTEAGDGMVEITATR